MFTADLWPRNFCWLNHQGTKTVLNIKTWNSSDSGDQRCEYANQTDGMEKSDAVWFLASSRKESQKGFDWKGSESLFSFQQQNQLQGKRVVRNLRSFRDGLGSYSDTLAWPYRQSFRISPTQLSDWNQGGYGNRNSPKMDLGEKKKKKDLNAAMTFFRD